MINQPQIKGIQREAIVFFLEKIKKLDCFSKKEFDILIKQINEAEIFIEKTPYYSIVKFQYNGHFSYEYDKNIEMQVINKAHLGPVVFHMYIRDNELYEFEYFNADSSEIDEKTIFIGDVFIDIYTTGNPAPVMVPQRT